MCTITIKQEIEEIPSPLGAFKTFLAFDKEGLPLLYLNIVSSMSIWSHCQVSGMKNRVIAITLNPTRPLLIQPESVESCYDCGGQIPKNDFTFTEPPINGLCSCWEVAL